MFVESIKDVTIDDIRGYIYWSDIGAKIIGRLDVRHGTTSHVVAGKLSFIFKKIGN